MKRVTELCVKINEEIPEIDIDNEITLRYQGEEYRSIVIGITSPHKQKGDKK